MLFGGLDIQICTNPAERNRDSSKPFPEGLGDVQQEILRNLPETPLFLRELQERMGSAGSGQVPQEGDLVRTLLELEDRGLVQVRFPGDGSALKGFSRDLQKAQRACVMDPGLWNVLAYELEWFRYREYFDFLNPEAPNHRLKCFERDLYLKQFQDILQREIRAGGRILDAGGGIGRFSSEFLRQGYEVVLVDASERALKIALRHFSREGFENFTLFHGDVQDLKAFPDDSFDAVTAMELLCYCTRPEQALQELMRVVVPGGWMFFSVEGKYGSLLTDSKIGLDQFSEVCKNNKLLLEHDVFVRYFTEEGLLDFLSSQGVSVVETKGSHYVPDGVFHRFMESAGTTDGEVEERILRLEEHCGRDPVLQPLARAWTAICRNGC